MNKLLIYCDGSCLINPNGHTGIGIVMIYKEHRKEISLPMGIGTNNTAELNAIKIALENVKDRKLDTILMSDSKYALNVSSGVWNPSCNLEIIAKIRVLLAQFSNIELKWIRGHSGIKEQERSDYLAVQAALLSKASGD